MNQMLNQQTDTQMKRFSRLVSLSSIWIIITISATLAAGADAATDPQIEPRVRAFLADLNGDGSPSGQLLQPKPQGMILTALQTKTPVDTSGATTTARTIKRDGRTVKLHITKPQQVAGKPGILFFIHRGVWIVGNFQNHERLLRVLVVGSRSSPASARNSLAPLWEIVPYPKP